MKVWYSIGLSVAGLTLAAWVLFRHPDTEGRIGAGILIGGALIILVAGIRASVVPARAPCPSCSCLAAKFSKSVRMEVSCL